MKILHTFDNRQVVLVSAKGMDWHTQKEIRLIETSEDGSKRILKKATVSTRQDKFSKLFAASTTTRFIKLCNNG